MIAQKNMLASWSRCVVSALISLAAFSALRADEPRARGSAQSPSPPEVRSVAQSQAKIYAGPSDEFYPTQILKQGETVEVYERTGDGWLAIRPPQGSFSWLPAAQGLLLPGGRVVEVVDKSAVSWIGSALGTAKQYRWQVRLDRGDQLAVIGEQTLLDEQSDKKTLWYKITPPSGEYRWIREEDTTSDSSTLQAVASDEDQSNEGTSSSDVSENRADHSVLLASAEEPSSDNSTVKGQRRTSDPRRARHQNANSDRWADWHAVEFKDGNFSFPGIARMLGMEPAPSTGKRSSYDPFDLNVARPPNIAPRDAEARATSGDPAEHSGPEPQLMAHRPRGWRDPRQLREARSRDGAEPLSTDAPDESLIASVDGMSDEPLTNLVSTFFGNDAVGTGVITAGATSPATGRSPGQVSDASWYGIRQAPQPTAEPPLELHNADLDEVQVRLSEIVAGPEHTWNLAPLADRTRYLIEHGQTSIERGEARLLLDRIEAFVNVARRSTELGMTAPVALPATLNASLSSSPIAAAAARWATPLGMGGSADVAASGSAPRFDATGWVVPVHTSGHDMPTHALTNDTGSIIVYLTPAAGVNLARYQGQAVGVYGLRGYLPQLKANHIQVQRAVRLQ